MVRLGAGAGVDREARLLAAVAGIAPLPVPEPSFTIPGRGCLFYRKLRGVPLLGLPESRWSAHTGSIAATLGGLLTALCVASVELMAVLVGVDDRPLDRWRLEAAQTYAVVAGEVPVVYRRPVEAFLEAPPPAGGWVAVFSNSDLGPAAARAALGGYRTEVDDLATLEERVRFHARCTVLEDLAYGIQTGQDRYRDKSLAGLAWLFPA